MSNRWAVLAILFLARVAMAFQFQSVATLSPVYMDHFGVTLADIGVLFGLYLSPGLLIAYPGGAIGQRFGDRTVIAVGMVLMVAGAVLMLLSTGWTGQIAGRVLGGVGGVLLNVLMTKVVADQFEGGDIATAMAIFVNSWPVGIALCLVVLPLLGGTDPVAAQTVVLVVTACGLALFLIGVPRARATGMPSQSAGAVTGETRLLVLLAGTIWGLYNGGLSMIFGFGPSMLVEDGMSLAPATATVSIVIWMIAISAPLGGVLADRTGARDAVILVGFAITALLLIAAEMTGGAALVFVALGLAAGIPVGSIMSLPASILAPAQRARGMGLFFTMFYVGVVFSPLIAGAIADATGSASAAFYFGAILLGFAAVVLGVFRRVSAVASRD